MLNEELIKNCQLGNPDSLDELYRIYSQKAYKTACFISRNNQLAEDIVQETFIQCFLYIKNLKKPELFNNWFFKILVRESWRLTSKYKHISSKESNFQNINLLQSNELTENIIIKKELHKHINDVLHTLNLTLKTTIILYYYNNLSINDISKIMNCLQGTVKSRLHTARKIIGKKTNNYINLNNSDKKIHQKECISNE